MKIVSTLENPYNTPPEQRWKGPSTNLRSKPSPNACDKIACEKQRLGRDLTPEEIEKIKLEFPWR